MTAGEQPLTIVRKSIKNMYLRLYPDGEIVVSAPRFMPKETILAFVRQKEEWLARQKEAAKRRPVPVADPGRVLLWGREYRLIVARSPKRRPVTLTDEEIVVTVGPGADGAAVQRALMAFYKERLLEKVFGTKGEMEKKIGRTAALWTVRDMKSRWGSCAPQKKKICLNARLALMPPVFLAYVMTHELTHLLERGHNPVFYGYMDSFFPGWREIRKELADFR